MAQRWAGLAVAAIAATVMFGSRPRAQVADCEYHVSPLTIDLSRADQTGTVRIETQPGCAWTVGVTTQPDGSAWLTLDKTGGTGSDVVTYHASAMPPPGDGGQLRQLFIAFRWPAPTAGQNVVVTQAWVPGKCGGSFYWFRWWYAYVGPSADSSALEALGVTLGSGDWNFTSAPDWITFVPDGRLLGRGDGGRIFLVQPNPGTQPRDGTIVGCSGQQFVVHQAGQTPGRDRYTRGDFDGDGKADLAVFRPDGLGGTWYVLTSGSGYSYPAALVQPAAWGYKSTRPVAADFDGDNKADVTELLPTGDRFFSTTWFDRRSAWNIETLNDIASGSPDDIPVPADFAGHGKDDFAVFNPLTGEWNVRFSSWVWNASLGALQALLPRIQWGAGGDVPIAADFDGDGKADMCVWRPSDGTWYTLYSTAGYAYSSATRLQWGRSGDVPINGDFDGDGRNDVAVWRPSDGTWYVLLSSRGFDIRAGRSYQWGLPGDIPMAADYDGDGKTDLAVWRPSNGTWYLLFSSTGYSPAAARSIQWGSAALGDEPVRGSKIVKSF
jgi:hypothetical protein